MSALPPIATLIAHFADLHHLQPEAPKQKLQRNAQRPNRVDGLSGRNTKTNVGQSFMPLPDSASLIRGKRCAVDQTSDSQLGHIGNVGVSEVPAHSQHCTDTLQKNIPALGIDVGGGLHDGFQLLVGQYNHAAFHS